MDFPIPFRQLLVDAFSWTFDLHRVKFKVVVNVSFWRLIHCIPVVILFLHFFGLLKYYNILLNQLMKFANIDIISI